MMRIWKEKYLKLVSDIPEIKIDYYYITGDDEVPNSIAEDSGERVKKKLLAQVKCICNIHYIGASELWTQVKKRPPKSKMLHWAESAMSAAEGFVGLVKLNEFFNFIQDEPGILAERIFESNVRGYQAETSVNKQIRQSLETGKGTNNFWLLNNGVTIICPSATHAGHLQISIDDPQIVNGLQTSREIFLYGTSGKVTDLENDPRTVLVRVIQTAEPKLQDMIIRATNSQNKMVPASLRMTDQIHRNIEEVFGKVELYYDRRKGYYRDQAKPVVKIVSVNELVQSVVAILLQRPDDARARPGDYFNVDEKYDSVFGDPNISIDAYLSCVQIVRRIDQYLDKLDIERGEQRNLKFYCAAFLVVELMGFPKPVPEKLPSFSEVSKIDEKIIAECYKIVKKSLDFLSKNADRDTVARGSTLLKRLNNQWKRRLSAKHKKLKLAKGAA